MLSIARGVGVEVAALQSEEFALTTSPQNLTTLFGFGRERFIGALTIRSDQSNSGTVYVGRNLLTTTTHRGGYIKAGEAMSFSAISTGLLSSSTLYILSTHAGDTVYISLLL